MGLTRDFPEYHPMPSVPSEATKLAGAAVLGAAIVLSDHEHTHVEIDEAPAPVGQAVFVVTTTGSSMTSGPMYLYSTGSITVSPVFKIP